MMLQRFNQNPMNQFRHELDRLISGGFAGFPDSFPGQWTQRFPALNVWQDETNLFVEAEVPGLTLDQVEVVVQGDQLTIKGESSVGKVEDAKYTTRERVERKFTRNVSLPVAVNAEAVKATLKDGVLTVTLPKAQEVLPKRIEVKG